MSIYNSEGRAINFLQRALLHSGPGLTPQQIQCDEMLRGFTAGASDLRSLFAMTAGGFAYRATKLGVLKFAGNIPGLSRLFATGLGLVSEVSIVRRTQSLLSSPVSPFVSSSSWSSDFVSFASLRVFGRISQGRNPVFSHSVQCMGMVAGHHLAYGLNLATLPEGSLIQQLAHAEMVNLQMQSAMSLMGFATGNRLRFLERSLDLQVEAYSPSLSQKVNLQHLIDLPLARMSGNGSAEDLSGLVAVKSVRDIYSQYRDTPIGRLLEYHNLGRSLDAYTRAELLVGMCMDNRKLVRAPENFAFFLRTGGADLRNSGFKIAFAIGVGGVKHFALIGHTQCGMSGLEARKEAFIEGMVNNAGWTREYAESYFNDKAPQFEIGNVVNFTLSEVRRLRDRYPKLVIAPLIYRIEDNQLYHIEE